MPRLEDLPNATERIQRMFSHDRIRYLREQHPLQDTDYYKTTVIVVNENGKPEVAATVEDHRNNGGIVFADLHVKAGPDDTSFYRNCDLLGTRCIARTLEVDGKAFPQGGREQILEVVDMLRTEFPEIVPDTPELLKTY